MCVCVSKFHPTAQWHWLPFTQCQAPGSRLYLHFLFHLSAVARPTLQMSKPRLRAVHCDGQSHAVTECRARIYTQVCLTLEHVLFVPCSWTQSPRHLPGHSSLWDSLPLYSVRQWKGDIHAFTPLNPHSINCMSTAGLVTGGGGGRYPVERSTLCPPGPPPTLPAPTMCTHNTST